MIDIRFLRENPEVVKENIRNKFQDSKLPLADMLLKMNSNEKIGIIAKKCGFDDVGYFCKAYKKRFGTTPSKSR